MNKTAFKIFFMFSLTAAALSIFLLGVNFLSFGFIGSDTGDRRPKTLVSDISAAYEDKGPEAAAALVPEDCWCLLLDGGGEAVWEANLPSDVPLKYSLADVARLTRWFLKDYPVYVNTLGEGLMILGTPKNSVGKYDVIYSMDWFSSLPQRAALIFLANLLLALALALIFGAGLYRRLRALMLGLEDLKAEREVSLPERGLFREIFRSLNAASGLIRRKNAALAKRDSARINWVSGISHDLRTPLAVIVGAAEELGEEPGLGPDGVKKAALIAAQGLKIGRLVEDMNLISSLEYDMQPSRKAPVKLCPLLRRTAAELVNSGGAAGHEISLDLRDGGAEVMGDEALLGRAFFNLINNSLVHNPAGSRVEILQYRVEDMAVVEINDDGVGAPREVLDRLDELPRSAHGLGLPMARRIVEAHGGTFSARSGGGLKVRITLPEKGL